MHISTIHLHCYRDVNEHMFASSYDTKHVYTHTHTHTNINFLYRYNPIYLASVVISQNSSDSSSQWKPHFRSSFENSLLLFIAKSISSILGTGNLCSIASFAYCLSMHNHMSQLFSFGTTTIGLKNEVGPSAHSILEA